MAVILMVARGEHGKAMIVEHLKLGVFPPLLEEFLVQLKGLQLRTLLEHLVG